MEQDRQPEVYDQIAPFYDLGTAEFEADIAVYLEFGRRSRHPVLELGCGSGRVALPLARAGLRVVGLDRSPEMLARASAKFSSDPDLLMSLVRADMRSFSLSEQFGLIVVPLDAFLHIETQADQLACLRCVRAHLASDGLVILDLPGPASGDWGDWSPGIRPLVLAWTAPTEDGATVSKFSSFTVDAAEQMHTVTEIYEHTGSDGTLRRRMVDYPLRYVFPAELELLFAESGLGLRARYGDYDLSPFQASSPRQIAIAEAANRRRAQG